MVAPKKNSELKGNKILVQLPQPLLEEIDAIAKKEYRTRSDLFREALRRYTDAFKRNQQVIANTRIEALTSNGTE